MFLPRSSILKKSRGGVFKEKSFKTRVIQVVTLFSKLMLLKGKNASTLF